MTITRSLVLSLGLVFSMPSWAISTEVVEIYYRSASEMVSLLKHHLEPGETVSGLDGKLVLRLKPGHRPAILALIRQMDQRPEQLLVTVRQSENNESDSKQAGISGGIRYGAGRPSGTIMAHGGRQKELHDTKSEQQIRVQDGQSATFYIGQVVPLRSPPLSTHDGYLVHEGVYYEEVLTGFVVRPRLRGEQVYLEISPQSERLDNRGGIHTRFAQTTVEAAIGQWIEIGRVFQDESHANQGVASASRQHNRLQAGVQIRVDRSQ